VTSRRDHLVLVNLGTPTAPTPEAVREFLDEFLSDPAVVDYPAWFWQPFLRRVILPKRPIAVAHAYQAIWSPEGSPLRAATDRIARAARESSGELEIHTAYRYGEPSLHSVMREIAPRDPARVVVVPLFPQRTDPTTGTAFTKAREAAAAAGIANRLVERVMAPDDPGYVEAMAARWREATAAGEPDHLVVSFHGIPKRFNRKERSLYTRDCEATTRALLAAIRWPAERATLAYQSKFGPEPWLTPATATVLEELPKRGVKSVAVITPGFVTEGLETIEEIGMRGAESFRGNGGERFIRIGAVEEHPAFVRAIVRLAR
jgi:ferrochelatase